MTELFADAHYYIALLNPNDQYHGIAKQATAELRHSVVTTVWILMEVADALCAPAARQTAHLFLEKTIADPKITVIANIDPWLPRGLALYGNRPDKRWSLTDCISFEVMHERGITDALTADNHFTQAGFHALLALRGV